MTKKNLDSIQRFSFDDFPVRGEIVSLDSAWRAVLEGQDYPTPVRRQLGELVAATVLLASTLKYEGRLTAQVESDGPLSLMVVQCTHTLAMRGVARFSDLKNAQSFSELTQQGRLVITIDTKDRRQPYQGVVPLVGDSLVHSIEHYFETSVQLPARLWLRSDARSVSGLMLQKMPETQDHAADEDAWQRVQYLGDTVKQQELAELSSLELIRRLFHEETLRVFNPRPVSFRCSCSKDGMGNVLKLLDATDIEELLEERGFIEVRCEFCNRVRQFDPVDVHGFIQGGMDPSVGPLH